jgi:16S rRNA (uracil1498-N3)-methyltransferase
MFVPRIYYPHPLTENTTLELDKNTSHYLANVLRLKDNERVILFNGQGGEYQGQLTVLKKKVNVQILHFQDVSREAALALHLGQGLIRGDRMDYVIQKATELGVASITPLISATCSVKLDNERSEKRILHWQNIAVSAAEQSGRTQVPVIHSPSPLANWVNQAFTGLSMIFDLDAKTALKNIRPTKEMRLAVGPESGWIEQETAFMVQKGFQACTLGPRILRTETAPVVALSILQGLFGDI